jgi:prepilin-type N-terminal cleavage/methylation domain-containing protein
MRNQISRTPAVRRRQSRPAFSLTEMLVVLALIGIVAGWALPRVDVAKFRADAAARVVRGTLQQAQRLAILRQYDISVGFDTTARRLRIHEDVNNDGIQDPGERVMWRPIEEGVAFAKPPVGVNGTSATSLVGSNLRAIGDLPTIIFRRDGSASTDLEVYLLGAVDHPTSFRAVTVIQSTGRADPYRYRGSAWAKGGA